MKSVFFLCMSVVCLFADLQAPVAGVVRDRHGYLRQILGVPGAFVAGEALASGVQSASFSGLLGLAKTDGEVLIFDSQRVVKRYPAPSGPAKFGFDERGHPAWVMFQHSDEVWRWQAGQIIVTQERNHRKSSQVTEERMSAQWTVVHTEQGDFAVRGDESLQLPEVVEP